MRARFEESDPQYALLAVIQVLIGLLDLLQRSKGLS